MNMGKWDAMNYKHLFNSRCVYFQLDVLCLLTFIFDYFIY